MTTHRMALAIDIFHLVVVVVWYWALFKFPDHWAPKVFTGVVLVLQSLFNGCPLVWLREWVRDGTFHPWFSGWWNLIRIPWGLLGIRYLWRLS